MEFYLFAHNIHVKDVNFTTDMILEAAQNSGFGDMAEKTSLSDCIELRKLEIKDDETAKNLDREKGIYLTFDVTKELYSSNDEAERLENEISSALNKLFFKTKRSAAKILIACLGNSCVASDSLGAKVAPLIAVNAQSKNRLYAFEPGVYGATGIKSATVIFALAKEIKPDLVIAVDSLATSSVSRIGRSYQISTAGIVPGSGVGGDNTRIDNKALGVPVAAIGVPLVLSVRTLMNNFFGAYFRRALVLPDAAVFNRMLSERELNNLIVAPKDISFYADICASIIANAINKTFVN